jgi:acyl-coenzyme A thioesterase PaaI-like protein
MLDKLLAEKAKAIDPSGRANFPPKVANLLNGELVDYQAGESMTMRFPIKPEFDNPFHITFGGVYGMFFDMVFGPFSSIETGIGTTSLDLNVSFIKSVSVADKYVTVKATIISQSKQFIILEGRAYKGDNILVATCSSRMMIIDPKRMNTMSNHKV